MSSFHNNHIYMYICIYVYMYICIYVCGAFASLIGTVKRIGFTTPRKRLLPLCVTKSEFMK